MFSFFVYLLAVLFKNSKTVWMAMAHQRLLLFFYTENKIRSGADSRQAKSYDQQITTNFIKML
jgi:hypothetical protein